MADHSSGTVKPVRLALVLLAIVLISGLIGWWIPMSLPTLSLAIVFGIWFYTSTQPWWRGP
jgi:hypothetical protein